MPLNANQAKVASMPKIRLLPESPWHIANALLNDQNAFGPIPVPSWPALVMMCNLSVPLNVPSIFYYPSSSKLDSHSVG
jgi:hypothetical protein